MLERCGLGRVLHTISALKGTHGDSLASLELSKQPGLEALVVSQAVNAFYGALFTLSLDKLELLQAPQVKVSSLTSSSCSDKLWLRFSSEVAVDGTPGAR